MKSCVDPGQLGKIFSVKETMSCAVKMLFMPSNVMAAKSITYGKQGINYTVDKPYMHNKLETLRQDSYLKVDILIFVVKLTQHSQESLICCACTVSLLCSLSPVCHM